MFYVQGLYLSYLKLAFYYFAFLPFLLHFVLAIKYRRFQKLGKRFQFFLVDYPDRHTLDNRRTVQQTEICDSNSRD